MDRKAEGEHSAGEDKASADDLPDIVDVVMEMRQAPADPPSPRPQAAYGSQPTSGSEPTFGLPAHLGQLADHARKYVEVPSSANTRRA